MIPKDPTSIYRADTIDLVAVWQLLWSYKYLVGVIACVCAGLAVVLALTAKEVYRAEAVIIPTRQDGISNVSSSASGFSGLARSLTGLGTWNRGGLGTDSLAVLESRRLVEEFIQRNDLMAELFPDADPPPTLWLAVDLFRKTIVSIDLDDDRGRTAVAIKWTDPSVAATWANEFVALANDLIRTRALDDANRNVDYLNEQLEQTNVIELRQVLYNLIQTETQKVMLGNAREEYAFTVVDPAVTPEERFSPRRTLMVLAGGVLGVFLGVIVVLVRNAVLWSQVGGVTTNADGSSSQPS